MKSLEFGSKYFDAVIALNADLPDKSFFDKLNNVPIYAADGAAGKLIDNGITPDFAVGDLDSFSLHPHSQNFPKEKVIFKPDQNSNDFEKTLVAVLEAGLFNCLIVGFNGGELEHTLNNWSVLMRFAKTMNLCLYNLDRYGIPIFESITLNVRKKEMLSLIPQPRVKLTTKNLNWELSREILELGTREGARNFAVSEEVTLEIHEGSMLIFIEQRLPFSPHFK